MKVAKTTTLLENYCGWVVNRDLYYWLFIMSFLFCFQICRYVISKFATWGESGALFGTLGHGTELINITLRRLLLTLKPNSYVNFPSYEIVYKSKIIYEIVFLSLRLTNKIIALLALLNLLVLKTHKWKIILLFVYK